jgi:hypothetical protein
VTKVDWIARARLRLAYRRANSLVSYAYLGGQFDCHPLVLELIGKRPGDRIASFDEFDALCASEQAHALMSDCIYRVKMAVRLGLRGG